MGVRVQMLICKQGLCLQRPLVRYFLFNLFYSSMEERKPFRFGKTWGWM